MLPLIELLDENGENDLREYIVRTLGNLRDKRATSPLLKLLNNIEDWKLRSYVFDALRELKNSRAIEPLKKQLEIEKEYTAVMNLKFTLEKLEKED